jgi:DNA-binding LacI/PurR family transcriptional regulator
MSDRMALAARSVIVDWPGTTLVAAVGFDDIAAARAAGLTTIRQNAVVKGETAVRIVLDGEESVLLPLELIVRDT